nr:hypothetical protein [Tanacetum cinerariifolium]
MSVKDSISTQTCELTKEEFNDFLTLYHIPSEYRVILPKSNKTVFNAPPRFIYPGLILLVVPSSPLLLSCARLMVVSPLSTSSEGSSICVELRLDRYPTSVCVFPNPILFLAGLKPSWEHGQQRPAIMIAFTNFIYAKDDENLSFLPKEPSPGFSTGSLSVSVKTEPLKADEELMIQPAEIKDRKCKTRVGSSRPFVKRKLAPGSSTSLDTRAKTSSLKDDVLYLTVSNDDQGLPDVLELKDASTCHLNIYVITPPAWKNHLDNHIDVELLDLHDRCYARQAVADNAVNRRSRELLQVIKKLRGEFDVMKDWERARKEECEEMQAKCEAAMTEFEKNPTVSQKWAGYQQILSTLESKVTSLEAEKARLEAVEVSLRKEVEELTQDRIEVVSKVVSYAAMELVHSDHMGSLVGRLVSSTIFYGSFIVEEAFISSKTGPSRNQVPLPSSQRATPSSVPIFNPVSPPANASVVKP